MTLKISAIALVFSMLLGLVAGLGRIAKNPAVYGLATSYVELFRGTPLLVQIFIFYFFVGTVLNLSAFTAGVAALAGFTGQYVAEITRAGIEEVQLGQMEASRTHVIGGPTQMSHVVLPEAVKKTLR